MTTPIRVLIADDHPIVRDGIRSRLGLHPHLALVGEASDGEEVLQLAPEVKPDVIMLDISMPGLDGLETASRLGSIYPQGKILFLSMHKNPAYILNLSRYRSQGYVLKDASAHEMVAAIEQVHRGTTYLSSGVSSLLLDYCNQMAEAPPEDTGLSQRECTVIALVADGLNSKAIAARLGISVRTVEKHRHNIKTKLGIRTSAGLARYALERGLVAAKEH